MRIQLAILSVVAAVVSAGGIAQALSSTSASGPDLRELPVPEIRTDLGSMPGVSELVFAGSAPVLGTAREVALRPTLVPGPVRAASVHCAGRPQRHYLAARCGPAFHFGRQTCLRAVRRGEKARGELRASRTRVHAGGLDRADGLRRQISSRHEGGSPVRPFSHRAGIGCGGNRRAGCSSGAPGARNEHPRLNPEIISA